MSNKVLKDSIWTSKKLSRCSLMAQLHYPRLYLLTDDWSCLEIDLDVIRGRAYPKLPVVTLKDIEGYLKEFEGNGLLFVWTLNGSVYGYFTGKEEGRLDSPSRRHSRKTPEPPQEQLTAYYNKFNTLEESLQSAYKEGSNYLQNGLLNLNLNLNPNLNPNPPYLSEVKTPDEQDIKLVQLLIELMEKNYPDSSTLKRLTPKRQDDWVRQCRLLREADKRTPEEIETIIRFSQSDSFWKNNILSMPKLREQWDQLYMKAKQASGADKYDGIKAWLDKQTKEANA